MDICQGHSISYTLTCAPSEESDPPAHPCSRIRISAGLCVGSQGSKTSSDGQWRIWLACADTQADLSLHLAHTNWPLPFSNLSTIYRQCCFTVHICLVHCSWKMLLSAKTINSDQRCYKRENTNTEQREVTQAEQSRSSWSRLNSSEINKHWP